MHRIAAVLNLLTQLNKLSSNNFIRHECQNGIRGGCFFILFDGYTFRDLFMHFYFNVNRAERNTVVYLTVTQEGLLYHIILFSSYFSVKSLTLCL